MRALFAALLLAGLVTARNYAGTVEWKTTINWQTLVESYGTTRNTNQVLYAAETTQNPISGPWARATAYNASTGEMIKQLTVTVNSLPRPIFVNGSAYLFDGDVLMGYPNSTWATSVNPSWKSGALPCNATTLTYGNSIFFASCAHGYVFAIDAVSGDVLWAASAAVNSITPPKLLYVPSSVMNVVVLLQGGVTALVAATGEQLWNRTDIDNQDLPMDTAPDGSQLYLGVQLQPNPQTQLRNVSVMAVTVLTGVTIWNFTASCAPPGAWRYGNIAADIRSTERGVTVFCSPQLFTAASLLASFDGTTGAEQWRRWVPGQTAMGGPVTVSDRQELITCGYENCTGTHLATGEASSWYVTLGTGVSLNWGWARKVLPLPGMQDTFVAMMTGGNYNPLIFRGALTPLAPTPAPANFAVVKACASTDCAGASCSDATVTLGCNGQGVQRRCGMAGRSLVETTYALKNCTGAATFTQSLFEGVCTQRAGGSAELMSCG